MSLPRLYTVKELCAQLKVSPRHVHNLIATGQLETVRVGTKCLRIPEESVLQMLGGTAKKKKPVPTTHAQAGAIDFSAFRTAKGF